MIHTSTILATYCSAEKRDDPGLLPASHRYLSTRIRRVSRAAEELRLPWMILSGKFGLIDADAAIPDYDHLLQDHELEEMVPGVVRTLADRGIVQVLFFSRSLDDDPRLGPYLGLMRRAARRSGAALVVIEIDCHD